MKRLWVFVILCTILLGSTSSILLPNKAFAQTAQQYDAKKSEGTTVINSQISYLNQRLADPALRQQWGGSSDPRWVSYTQSNPAFVSLLTNAITTYNTNFENARQGGANPDASYAAALLSVVTAINQGNIQPRGNIINADITTVNRNINTAASALTVAAQNSGDPAALANAQQTAAQQAVARAAQENTAQGKCISLTSFSLSACINEAVTWFIKNTLLQFAGFILWVTANLLNTSIQIGVLNFAQWAPDTLYPIWVIIRQIVSLFVVFAGLWLGFMYIIGKGKEFERYVPWIIMFALFVNFSYPLTRGLVDISNVISLNIYTSAVGSDALIGNSPNGTPGALITSRLGLQGLVASATAVESGANAAGFVDQINSVPGALLAVVFVVYAAWIFAVSSIIIVGRTAMLVFLIVASPLLFVDSVIPKLGEKAAEMRKLFFSQLVVAPVFMIMLALTLKFLQVFQASLGTTGVGGVATSSVTVFFNILMMLIMLHIMNKVTRSVSGSVGEFATKTIGTVGGFALGAGTMGAGLIARQSIGRAALAARNSKWVTNNQDSFLGRHAYNMSNSLSSSTFDARNSSFVKTNMDKVGLGMGMGSKLGYEQTAENRTKDRMSRYNRIETRYKKNVYDDKTGALLHSEGDTNEEGIKAAARFREKEGRTAPGTGVTGALKKADRVIFNKGALGDEFEKANQKMNEEDKKALDTEVSSLMKDYMTNPETGRPATQKEKAAYRADLDQQIQKAKETDPQLSGIRGQALVKGLNQIKEADAKQVEDLEKQVTKLFNQYNLMDVNKRALFLEQQEEDIKIALQNKINNPQSSPGTAAFGNIAQTLGGSTQPGSAPQVSSAQMAPVPSWVDQSGTRVPAYQRQAQAGGAPSGPGNVQTTTTSTQVTTPSTATTQPTSQPVTQPQGTPYATSSGFDIHKNSFSQMMRSQKPQKPDATTSPVTPPATPPPAPNTAANNPQVKEVA